MTYFRQRNNLKNEYSGYQEISQSLRNRLNTVCESCIAKGIVGMGQEGYWIYYKTLEHQLSLNLEVGDISEIISEKNYDYVFEAIEIFVDVAKEKLKYKRQEKILSELQNAFTLSGSVYYLNTAGEVCLRMTEDTAEKLKETEKILQENKNAYQTFFDAVSDLIQRKNSPENIVKDLFIGFENYLKDKTNENDFGNAVKYLQKNNIISKIQKSLLEKLYAYRSDSYKVAHSGNAEKPVELDALWFLETVIAQINFIDKKLKQL